MKKYPWLPSLLTQLCLPCEFPLEIKAMVQLYRIIKLPELGVYLDLVMSFYFNGKFTIRSQYLMHAFSTVWLVNQ